LVFSYLIAIISQNSDDTEPSMAPEQNPAPDAQTGSDNSGNGYPDLLVPYMPGNCDSPLEPAVVEALRGVYDPEIPASIFDLGLIYNLDINADGEVKVLMTLTTPSCPVAEEIPSWVQRAINVIEGVTKVEIELTWEPFWKPDYMSEEARLALGMMF